MNPLDQLKDIHLPPEVSFWPLAWPWWLMLVTIIAIVVLLIWQRQRQAWRRAALKQVSAINWQEANLAYRQANKLLKQIAIQKIDAHCARLSGEEWLSFLDKQVKTPIFMPQLRPFAHILDEPNIEIDNAELKKAISTWIRKIKC